MPPLRLSSRDMERELDKRNVRTPGLLSLGFGGCDAALNPERSGQCIRTCVGSSVVKSQD
jgi:hypothetical protein